MDALPLIPDSDPEAVLAHRGGRPVGRAEFLHEVLALAERLPRTGHVLNLCRDRYWFTVSFFATIARDVLSLLPNSTAPEMIAELQAEVPGLLCLGDQAGAPFDRLPYFRVPAADAPGGGSPTAVPRIPFERRIARVFTSGTTGRPQPHDKTFGMMHAGAAAEADRLWAAAGGPCAVVGTVPFQHMYGLESTVLLPVLGGGRLSARLPYFPADVIEALAELPAPRLLVTTPFHLRKLLESALEIPPLAAVLSATAPLSQELARDVEARFGAPLMEIYGSTETGQLATRRPATELEWQTYPGISLRQHMGTTSAAGPSLAFEQALSDAIELIGQGRFKLLGRNSDMVNIVGKRSSLAYLDRIILGVHGVLDAAFCVPEDVSGDEVTRLAAFVVAPGLTAPQILAALRPHLDPVFLPRPIVFVDALPRDRNGKIPARDMAALKARHLGGRA
jgi:acyl-coenzyme A synthetase/AMP-(fatty) acid ligase